MKKAILATKVGMTQIFNEDGVLTPVTVLQAGPCVVTQVKTVENDGYAAVQVGFVDKKEKVVKYVKSNAICIVKNGVTLAIGGGQTSRVWALENAIHNNQDKDFDGAVLASDAFLSTKPT